MSIDNQEITINLDAKRLAAITILAVISIYTLYTYSIALLAFVAPEASRTIGVTTLATYDTNNNPETQFDLGDIVRIKATVEKATAYNNPVYSVISDPQTVKVVLIVYYLDTGVRVPIEFWTQTMSLQPGVPKNIQFDIKIPTDGVQGNFYRVKILVWDDYLPGGGFYLIDETNSVPTEQEFEVTV